MARSRGWRCGERVVGHAVALEEGGVCSRTWCGSLGRCGRGCAAVDGGRWPLHSRTARTLISESPGASIGWNGILRPKGATTMLASVVSLLGRQHGAIPSVVVFQV